MTVVWTLSWDNADSVHAVSHWVDALVVQGLPVPVHIATWQVEAEALRWRGEIACDRNV